MRYKPFDEEEVGVQNEPKETLSKGLKQARDKIQEALAIIRALPESAWDDQIADFDNTAEKLEIKIDDLACQIQ